MGRKPDDVFLLGDEVITAEPASADPADPAPEPGDLPPGVAPGPPAGTRHLPQRLSLGPARATLLLGAAIAAAALALVGFRAGEDPPAPASPGPSQLATATPPAPAVAARPATPFPRSTRPREARPGRRWRELHTPKASSRSPRASRAPGPAAPSIAPPVTLSPSPRSEDFGFEQ